MNNSLFILHLQQREKRVSFRRFEQLQKYHPRFRNIIVKWMAIVAALCDFNLNSYMLAVNIFDRIVTKCKIPKTQLQLVGIVSLLLASKYEEDECISLHSLHRVSSEHFTIDEIKRSERRIIRKLHYDLGRPHSLTFLENILTSMPNYITHKYIQFKCLARYLCELSTQTHITSKMKPSKLAASCIYAAWYNVFEVLPNIENYTQYHHARIFDYINTVRDLYIAAKEDTTNPIVKRYSSIENMRVAIIF